MSPRGALCGHLGSSPHATGRRWRDGASTEDADSSPVQLEFNPLGLVTAQQFRFVLPPEPQEKALPMKREGRGSRGGSASTLRCKPAPTAGAGLEGAENTGEASATSAMRLGSECINSGLLICTPDNEGGQTWL